MNTVPPDTPTDPVIQPTFAVAPGLRVAWLDNDAIVFNPFSWETHILNPAAAVVLDCATSAPFSEAGIAELLAEVLDERERGQAVEHAHRVLKELLGLRLLAKVPPGPDAGR